MRTKPRSSPETSSKPEGKRLQSERAPQRHQASPKASDFNLKGGKEKFTVADDLYRCLPPELLALSISLMSYLLLFRISQGRGVCGTGPKGDLEILSQPQGGVLTLFLDPCAPKRNFGPICGCYLSGSNILTRAKIRKSQKKVAQI